MNTNTSSIGKFVKDGLVGVIVVLIVFLGWMGYWFGPEGGGYYPSGLSHLWEFIVAYFFFPNYSGDVFLSPMPFVILTAFIGVGISGRWLGNTDSRKSWIKNSLLVVVASSLAGIAVLIIPTILIHPYGYFSPIFAGALSGGVIGFVTGTLTGMVFNPKKRIYRILIGAVSSVCVAYGIGLGIWVIQAFP